MEPVGTGHGRTATRSPRRLTVSELQALQVRDEVLQAMYWMSSEGLADRPAAAELARFLAVPAETLSPFLERFTREGYLSREGDRFGLTAKGTEAGKRS